MTTSSYHLDTPKDLWDEFSRLVPKSETYNDRLVLLVGQHVLDEADLDEDTRRGIDEQLEAYR